MSLRDTDNEFEIVSLRDTDKGLKIISLCNTDNYGLVLHISVISTKYLIRIMIVFVLGFLWIPSVLGDCSPEAGDCQDGSCSDSCYIWRGPNTKDISLHYCDGDDVSDFIETSENHVKKL